VLWERGFRLPQGERGYDFASSLNSSSSDITFQFQFPVPVITSFPDQLAEYQKIKTGGDILANLNIRCEVGYGRVGVSGGVLGLERGGGVGVFVVKFALMPFNKNFNQI
jgi:hypothetical protein